MKTLGIAFMVSLMSLPSMSVSANDGAKVVSFYGYDDCIRLWNDRVSVTLCPASGGRVLEYSLDGKNVLYLPPGDEGVVYDPKAGRKQRPKMNAGRFDIGPEKVVRRGPVLWMGRWEGNVSGDRQAVLVSQKDPMSGAQLTRTFRLAAEGSRLTCTQKITNISEQPISLCHWSRTFAVGNGIAIVPREGHPRFPNGYVMYENGNEILINPSDPNISVTDKAVIISAAPKYPKLGFDSHAGWMAYLAPTNQMFIKRFATYPDRAYNEVAGLTISVWYPKEREMVELEPIGPAENLKPGESGSFTEEWWLFDHDFDGLTPDFPSIEDLVDQKTHPPKSG